MAAWGWCTGPPAKPQPPGRSESIQNVEWAQLRQRFRREAEAAAHLQHPNVVQIHAIGEHDGRSYLALEYCRAAAWPRGSMAPPGRPTAPPNWSRRWPVPSSSLMTAASFIAT